MRPSLAFVRSWFSSTDFESVSTLSFTSPTRCRTIFFVAHALVPVRASAEIATAVTNLFIAVPPLCPVYPLTRLTSRARAAAIPAPRANCEIPVLRLHVEAPKRFLRGLGEGQHVLVAQLVDDGARRDARMRRGAGHIQVPAGPSREGPERAVTFHLQRHVLGGAGQRHRHHVDRHVDLAGDRRDLLGGHQAAAVQSCAAESYSPT